MKTFHFNTGVNCRTTEQHVSEGIDSGNGVIVIPFDCEDVPERAEFAFACNSPNIKKDDTGFIVREIHNSRLLSKYAYFKISQ